MEVLTPVSVLQVPATAPWLQTDDVFSPCNVLFLAGTSNPVANAFATTLAATSNAFTFWTNVTTITTATTPTTYTTIVTYTYTSTVFPPRLPMTGTVIQAGSYNDEVYTLHTGVNPGDTISVYYTVDFTKSTANSFCDCQRSVVLNTNTGSATTVNAFFTDDNFEESGGRCPTP